MTCTNCSCVSPSQIKPVSDSDKAANVIANIAIGIGIVLLVVTVIGVPLLRVLLADGRYPYWRRYW